MILDQVAAGIPQMHSAAVDFILNEILICWGYLQTFELFSELPKDLLHVFMYCVHETETYFQLSQHTLLDQSSYNGLMKHTVCML